MNCFALYRSSYPCLRPNAKLFRVQQNNWSCGPAALRHALLCYGEQHSERKLARWCKTDRKGTTEEGLRRGAKRAGFRLYPSLYRTKELATATIRALLRNGYPVIFCTDKWRHWVCAYHATSRHLWVVDSDPDTNNPVQKLSWRAARQRIVKWQDSDDVRFDLLTLMRKR